MDKAIADLDKQIEEANDDRIEKQAKVVGLQKTLVSCKMKPTSKKDDDQRLILRNGKYYQNWTTPCPKFMKRFQPDKDDPDQLYREIR